MQVVMMTGSDVFVGESMIKGLRVLAARHGKDASFEIDRIDEGRIAAGHVTVGGRRMIFTCSMPYTVHTAEYAGKLLASQWKLACH